MLMVNLGLWIKFTGGAWSAGRYLQVLEPTVQTPKVSGQEV